MEGGGGGGRGGRGWGGVPGLRLCVQHLVAEYCLLRGSGAGGQALVLPSLNRGGGLRAVVMGPQAEQSRSPRRSSGEGSKQRQGQGRLGVALGSCRLQPGMVHHDAQGRAFPCSLYNNIWGSW